MTTRREKAREWTVNALAVELRTDRRTLTKRIDGLKPHRSANGRDYYWLRDVMNFIEGRGEEVLDPSQESAKLNQARREKVEIETRIMHGDLCETEGVRALWAEVVTNAKAKLLSMPHKITPQLIGLEYGDALALMETEVKAALKELEQTDGAPLSVQLQEEDD